MLVIYFAVYVVLLGAVLNTQLNGAVPGWRHPGPSRGAEEPT
jgi:hypothetical protein